LKGFEFWGNTIGLRKDAESSVNGIENRKKTGQACQRANESQIDFMFRAERKQDVFWKKENDFGEAGEVTGSLGKMGQGRDVWALVIKEGRGKKKGKQGDWGMGSEEGELVLLESE